MYEKIKGLKSAVGKEDKVNREDAGHDVDIGVMEQRFDGKIISRGLVVEGFSTFPCTGVNKLA